MKKIYLAFISLFLVGALVGFTSCSDDDDDNGTKISYNELPAVSKQFLTDHFTGFTLRDAYKKNMVYDVIMDKNAAAATAQALSRCEIKFDVAGNWLEIDGHGNTVLPDNLLALLPHPIITYVITNFASQGINEVERQQYGYKIELNGKGEELMFDMAGNYLGIDNGSSQVIAVTDLPAVSQTFLTTHFATETISKVVKDGDSYDVNYQNGVEVEFYLTGDWKEVDANGKVLPQTVIAILPLKLQTYLTTNHASRRVEEIQNNVSTYQVELERNLKLTFDKNGNFWGSEGNGGEQPGTRVEFSDLPANVQNVLSTHFLTGTTFLYAEKDEDDYDVKLANGTDVEFTLTGDLKKVEVLPGNSVPNALILAPILTYVQTNYAGKLIEEYEKNTLGYKVELSGYPEIELLFDTSGNFNGLGR